VSARSRRASLGLLFFLAQKSLRGSLLTAFLLVIAVAAGVGFQIPNTANLEGYTAELMEQGIVVGLGDVRLRPARGSLFKDGEGVAERARGVEGVEAAVPVLVAPGAVVHAGETLGTLVYGADSAAARQPYRLLAGQALEPGDSGGVLLGMALAKRLGVGVGDTVELRIILSSGDELGVEALDFLEQGCALGLPVDCGRARETAVRLHRFSARIRGLAGGAFSAYEAAVVDLAFLRALSESPRAASLVLVFGGDHGAARALSAKVGAELGPPVRARPWMEDSHYLRSSVESVVALGAISHTMVVSAVVIPVLSLLYINVLHRRREIGVLGAVGLGRGEIFAVFLLQALLVGAAGASIGCGLGYGLVRYFQARPIFGWDGFVIRPLVSAQSFLQAALVVTAATVLAGVYPALRAARVDPGRVLRG
jgi:ABC-type lipoprotein release transport system permease subunit